MSEELSYEYSHDHEDQHDEPQEPSKADMPSTELDAYERLLHSASSPAERGNGSRPSIMSTLTRTEETVLPDGTVQTKTVLRKRFSDGREEKSESIYTHNSKGNQAQYLWPPQGSVQQAKEEKVIVNKKSGWFWSN